MATKAATFADGFSSGAFARTPFTSDHARPRAQAHRQNRLSRVLAMLIAFRQRQADREIARYIASTGGKFTDQVEREIQRRLT
jgi:hypothetical protein